MIPLFNIFEHLLICDFFSFLRQFLDATASPFLCRGVSFTPAGADGTQHTLLNGEDVEKEIRDMKVSSLVSPVAVIPEVRHRLTAIQQEYGRDKGIVMDGRDIGTTVFPDAEMKVFVNASAEERARRRVKELTEKGEKVTYESPLSSVCCVPSAPAGVNEIPISGRDLTRVSVSTPLSVSAMPGFGNIDDSIHHFTQPDPLYSPSGKGWLKLYMPARTVFQIFTVHKIPLSACVFVAPSVSFTWEVDPFWMSELISHEIEISAVDGSQSHESYHFMQRHSATYCAVGVVSHHVPVHLLVDKAEKILWTVKI